MSTATIRVGRAALALVLAAAGCASPAPSAPTPLSAPTPSGTSPSGTAPTGASPTVTLPPTTGGFDYQLGGAYPLPTGVTVVVRDRRDPPAAGAYSVCYVNGFQVQPDEKRFWLDRHPELVLRDDAGRPVLDQDWGEPLLDTGTEAKRRAIATIVAGWIAGCARDGYQAVEIDNLDSYTRSGGALPQAGNVALMGRFSAAAHAHGLAAAQKNAVEVLPRVAEMGTDFAVAEECNRYDECAAYQRVYGDRVYVVEYTDAAFATGCRRWPNLLSVRRDLALAGPGAQGHLHRRC